MAAGMDSHINYLAVARLRGIGQGLAGGAPKGAAVSDIGDAGGGEAQTAAHGAVGLRERGVASAFAEAQTRRAGRRAS